MNLDNQRYFFSIAFIRLLAIAFIINMYNASFCFATLRDDKKLDMHVARRLINGSRNVCLYGFINSKGKWIVPPVYDDVSPFTDGMAAIKQNKKWGYININGEVSIVPRYKERPSSFSDGIARVYMENEEVYIDRFGVKLFEKSFAIAKPFCAGVAFVKRHGEKKWSLIDKGGEIIKENIYDGCSLSFSTNGLGAVRIEKKWGYINKAGEMVIDPRFNIASFFNEGLACVRLFNNPAKCGFINKTGLMKILPQFDEAKDFSCGRAAVRIDDKWGYIDSGGNMIITPQFKVNRNISTVANSFSDGVALVVIDRKYGFINLNGDMIIKPQYDLAFSFHNGLAHVFKHSSSNGTFKSVSMYIDKQNQIKWSE